MSRPSDDEVKAFKVAMRCHHPDATPAEESIAWRLWRSAWSERQRPTVEAVADWLEGTDADAAAKLRSGEWMR